MPVAANCQMTTRNVNEGTVMLSCSVTVWSMLMLYLSKVKHDPRAKSKRDLLPSSLGYTQAGKKRIATPLFFLVSLPKPCSLQFAAIWPKTS